MNYTVDKDTFQRVINNAAKSKTMPLYFEFCSDSLITAFDIRSQIKHQPEEGPLVALCNGFEFHMQYCMEVPCLATDAESFQDDQGDEGSYLFKVGSRDAFDQLLLDLDALSEYVLEFDPAGSFTLQGSKTTIDMMEVSEDDPYEIPVPGDFDKNKKAHNISWKSEAPEQVCFPVNSAEGYWGVATLPSAGSTEALNAVRKFIDRDKSQQIESGSNFMSARRGSRAKAAAAAPAVAAPPAASAPEAPAPPAFTCMACSDTGLNSKGGQCGPCIGAGRLVASAPVAPAPAAPVAAPAAPVAPPVAPVTVTAPPIDPTPAGEPTAPPEGNGEEGTKKKSSKRRSKAEIMQDKMDTSIAFLSDNKDSEGCHDRLRAFAKQVLEDDGYKVVRPDDAPDTIDGSLDDLLNMLTDAREKVLHTKAQTEGLVTMDQAKQKVLASLAAL